MLEVKKEAVVFDADEVIELQRIIMDRDEKDALVFLRKSVYEKVLRAQQGRLKSHLDTSGDPVKLFQQGPQ